MHSRKDLCGAKGGTVAILFSEDCVLGSDGPGDGDVGIVPQEGALSGGAVIVGDLVGQAHIVSQRGESMAESDRDVERESILGRELDGDVPAEVRRAAAQIDGNVQNGTVCDADQFGLRLNYL